MPSRSIRSNPMRLEMDGDHLVTVAGTPAKLDQLCDRASTRDERRGRRATMVVAWRVLRKFYSSKTKRF
jgi:hypothetical protein